MSEPHSDALVFFGAATAGWNIGQLKARARDSSRRSAFRARPRVGAGTWGPQEVEQQLAPPGGGHNPVVA